jgi:outer membrane protein
MKKLLFLALTLLSISYAQEKFACVDTGRILKESKLVAQAQTELREKLLEYQKKISEKEKKLEELKKQIESKAISKKKREEKIKEYQKIEAEARELQEKAQIELTSLKERLENMVYNRVREVVKKLSKENGYSAVLDCAVLLYKGELDITTEVLDLLDKDVKSK